LDNYYAYFAVYINMRPVCLFILLTGLGQVRLIAQDAIVVTLPDIQIYADQLIRGDADTYGLGDWHSVFNMELRGTNLKVSGKIKFTENVNDYTTIVGEYSALIPVPALEKCQSCQLSLVQGPNIGARGYKWYAGQGIIKRACIVTDTFGEDTGRIGGTIQFEKVTIHVNCLFAQSE
jgi:hypothetical protein